jgi:hypothetical protein
MTGTVEHFVWGSIAQATARSVVESVLDLADFGTGEIGEVSVLG